MEIITLIIVAFFKLDKDLQLETIELLKQLSDNELDEDQRFLTIDLLIEILFPKQQIVAFSN